MLIDQAGGAEWPRGDSLHRCQVALIPLAQAEPRSELLDRLVRLSRALSGHDDTSITWRDGTVMPVDDGVSDKPFDQMLRNASILDQMRLPYPTGPSAPPAPTSTPAVSATKPSSRRCTATAIPARSKGTW